MYFVYVERSGRGEVRHRSGVTGYFIQKSCTIKISTETTFMSTGRETRLMLVLLDRFMFPGLTWSLKRWRIRVRPSVVDSGGCTCRGHRNDKSWTTRERPVEVWDFVEGTSGESGGWHEGVPSCRVTLPRTKFRTKVKVNARPSQRQTKGWPWCPFLYMSRRVVKP